MRGVSLVRQRAVPARPFGFLAARSLKLVADETVEPVPPPVNPSHILGCQAGKPAVSWPQTLSQVIAAVFTFNNDSGPVGRGSGQCRSLRARPAGPVTSCPATVPLTNRQVAPPADRLPAGAPGPGVEDRNVPDRRPGADNRPRRPDQGRPRALRPPQEDRAGRPHRSGPGHPEPYSHADAPGPDAHPRAATGHPEPRPGAYPAAAQRRRTRPPHGAGAPPPLSAAAPPSSRAPRAPAGRRTRCAAPGFPRSPPPGRPRPPWPSPAPAAAPWSAADR